MAFRARKVFGTFEKRTPAERMKLGEVSGVELVSICEAYATTLLDFQWHNISTPPVTVLQIARYVVCVCVEVPTPSANNSK